MDLNRLTQKSQQAVQEAQSKALRYGHVEIDAEHLLLALLEQQDGLLPRLLTRMDVPSLIKANVTCSTETYSSFRRLASSSACTNSFCRRWVT